MDLVTGRRNRVPIGQLVRRTLRDLEPHARERGSESELEGVTEKAYTAKKLYFVEWDPEVLPVYELAK